MQRGRDSAVWRTCSVVLKAGGGIVGQRGIAADIEARKQLRMCTRGVRYEGFKINNS